MKSYGKISIWFVATFVASGITIILLAGGHKKSTAHNIAFFAKPGLDKQYFGYGSLSFNLVMTLII